MSYVGLVGASWAGEEEWTPQYNYWCRPRELDDGGGDIRGKKLQVSELR